MTLEHFAAIAEVIGAVAVVVTLVYFIVEIRKNTEAVRASTHQQQVDTTVTLNSGVSADPQLAALIASANTDYESLKPGEQLQLHYFYTNYFNMWNAQFTHRKKGLFDNDAWLTWDKGMTILLNSQFAMRETWNLIETIYGEDFRTHVENIIRALGEVASSDGTFTKVEGRNAT